MNKQLLKTSGADVLTSRKKKKLKKIIPVLKMTNTAKSSTLTFIAWKEKNATS